MPTKLGTVAGCSMTRPCECGLGLRPWRLFGFLMEPVDRAPCFFSGSLTLGAAGSRAPRGLPAASEPAMARYKGAGHMVHHVAPQQVAQAVESVTAASRMRAQPDRVADSGTAARELA